MKRTGYVIIALGLIGLSLNLSIARSNYYTGRLFHTFYPAIAPYIRELALPIALSALCLFLGVTLVIRHKQSKE